MHISEKELHQDKDQEWEESIGPREGTKGRSELPLQYSLLGGTDVKIREDKFSVLADQMYLCKTT